MERLYRRNDRLIQNNPPVTKSSKQLGNAVYVYAAFDRWAEHRAQGTPLAKTIPTLLAIALIYEIFPVDHFHPLLPLSAILIALMADWARFHLNPEAKTDLNDPPKTATKEG